MIPLALVLLLAVGPGARGPAQSSRRIVHLEATIDSDSSREQLTLREDETLVTDIEDMGTFGFEARFRKGNDATVLIVIFDAETSPPVLLGAVEVPVDGKRVESTTSPRFGLRIVRIERAR